MLSSVQQRVTLAGRIIGSPISITISTMRRLRATVSQSIHMSVSPARWTERLRPPVHASVCVQHWSISTHNGSSVFVVSSVWLAWPESQMAAVVYPWTLSSAPSATLSRARTGFTWALRPAPKRPRYSRRLGRQRRLSQLRPHLPVREAASARAAVRALANERARARRPRRLLLGMSCRSSALSTRFPSSRSVRHHPFH
jgi:hypothetical protein